MFGLTKSELSVFKKLSTPIKIQNFLDALPMNWEKRGQTYMSPRRVLREQKAHCLEGALLASLVLWINGEKPLLLDLKSVDGEDHVVALYKRNGYWGAISKTNHSVLRFRDPIYKTIRELALSYFHEYVDTKTGQKALRSYSRPFNVKKLGTKWITDEKEMHYIVDIIDTSPHTNIIPKKNSRMIRKADFMEKLAGKIVEWEKKHPRT